MLKEYQNTYFKVKGTNDILYSCTDTK